MRINKTNIEDPKKVKAVNPNPHSTICNPAPKPSFVLDTPNPQSQPVHSPEICHSPDDPPQDVDKSHLSDSTSTTTNLNETFSLDTSCDHLLHLDSFSLPSELQDNSIVESTEPESVPDVEDLLQLDSTSVSSQDTFSIEIEFVSESEGQLDNVNLTMPMNCSYYKRRLMHHITISVIKKLMYAKSKVKMNSSSMPLTLATTSLYPNSWPNTTVMT